MDILKAIDAPYSERFYENDGINDYKKKPYRFYLFLREFGVKKYGTSGKMSFFTKRIVIEITGKSFKEVSEKLDKEIDTCEGMVDASSRDWTPEKWIKIKKALKAFNLLQK